MENEVTNVGFTVDAGLIQRLGYELVGRAETAVSELIKNSYDADATVVDVDFINAFTQGGSLIISDNGLGMTNIIRKTKCFDFWERNVLFPKTKRSFFRTPKHPLPCPFPLNFSLLIITKKFGNLAKNRYICIV